jgi:hypothetical protein
VRTFADLEPELLGRVEELIDFVTELSGLTRLRALKASPSLVARRSFLSPGNAAPFGSLGGLLQVE